MEGDRMNTPSSDGINDAIRRTRTSLGRTSGPTRRSTKGQWTLEEDEILRQAVQRFKGKNWKKIAECFKDRTDVQCLHRWQKVLNPELVKGPWSKEEDEIIIQLVNKFGPKKWSTISQHLPGRIGKQCRERWHNHLNPGINKQAWTQEEELALIRAHQIYGNKWAELTKFLPGRYVHFYGDREDGTNSYQVVLKHERFYYIWPPFLFINETTDNSIKNHWNSSVKKKLDQYLASGLLQQFQGLPHVSHPSQFSASSSLKVQQSSEEDNVPKDGGEMEEVSECSSTIVGCSQSTSDLGNAVVHTIDECRIAEESCNEKDSSSSPSCSGKYLTAFQEVAFPISEVPNGLGGSSMFIESNFTHEWGASMANDWQINHNESHKPTLPDLGQESLGQFMEYMNGNDSHQKVPCLPQNSMSRSTRCFPFGTDLSGVDGFADPSLFQSSNYQFLENGTFGSQSCYLSSTDMSATSNCQQSSAPSQLPISDGSLIFGIEPSQFNYSIVGNQEHESLPDRHNDFICGNEFDSSPCDNGMKEKMPVINDASKLVAANDICSAPSREVQTSVDKNSVVHDDQTDSGALCYEPPRFPSLDIPFLSCDLIQSGTDMLQDYSPLGTRQFWTSFNRLWDSPSGEKSPDAVLKSAAKSYTRTPSILKKRNRDLVSPLSEKRSEKKFESTMSFSNLSREFSRLDVMFDEVANDKALKLSPLSKESRNSGDFLEDKENINPDLVPGKKDDVKGVKRTTFSGSKLLNEVDISAPPGGIKQKSDAIDSRSEYEGNNSKSDGEGNDEAAAISDRTIGPSVKALGNQDYRRMEVASIASSSSLENPCLPACSPRMSEKKDENNVVVTRSVNTASSSTPAVTKVALSRNGVSIENICIFGETPYRRSFESPSAWKSPWFMNSFLLGSRGDGDVTIEDYGHFLSPGNRGYDAIGLTKLLSEQTASAFADAQEVLGDETPQTLLKKKCFKNLKADGEINEISECQPEEHSMLASSVVAERRTLDFSDCGTPGKGIEAENFSNAPSFRSPSSTL